MNNDQIENLRQVVFEDISSIESAFEMALKPSQSNVFNWHGEPFWVDRYRRFALPQVSLSRIDERSWSSKDALPAVDAEACELLDIYAGEYQHEDTASISKMLALFVTGLESQGGWRITAAKLINLAIAQPSINPAFRPILWLALADDMGLLGDCRSNVYDLLKPMMYLQHPADEAAISSAGVRAEQLNFIERIFPNSTTPTCEKISDREWAQHCCRLLEKNYDFVDERLFASLHQDVLSLTNSDQSKQLYSRNGK